MAEGDIIACLNYKVSHLIAERRIKRGKPLPGSFPNGFTPLRLQWVDNIKKQEIVSTHRRRAINILTSDRVNSILDQLPNFYFVRAITRHILLPP